jgi:hypothetical protein
MFTSTLFTTPKLWNQSRCPTTDEWIKEIYIYTHTMEYYSDIKKNEIMSFVGKWMELEIIMLSKLSQVQQAKYHRFSLICGT